jgi:uncharacterized membrane protein YhiD involved in acid resistance
MQQFFTFSPINISAALILFNLLFAALVSLFIAFVYKKTHSGLSYSQSFFITLVLIAPISTVVIMVVQNNIFGALGLLGAFALIRFRTIVKETRDIAFLFFSLVEGVAIGANHYAIALISTLFIVSLAAGLSRINFGSVANNKHILMISTNAPVNENTILQSARSFGIGLTLLSSKKVGEEHEYTYYTSAKSASRVQEFLTGLSSTIPLKSYDLISGRDTVEY